MYIIGDIGNTETKICLFDNKKKLLKKKILTTGNIKNYNPLRLVISTKAF